MGYNKTIWTSGETPLSAGNMNKIEDGIDGIYKGENEIEFASDDLSNPQKSVDVELLESGETFKSIMEKISGMFRNVRYLLKMLGSTDITKTGANTVTSAISKLDDNVNNVYIGILSAAEYEYNSANALAIIKSKYAEQKSGTSFLGLYRAKTSASGSAVNWRLDGMKSSENYGYIKISTYSRSGEVYGHDLVLYDGNWEWRN